MKCYSERFKICYILLIRKSIVFCSFMVQLYISPYKWPDLCRLRPGHKIKKKSTVLHEMEKNYMKYSKFWSIWLEHFIESKPCYFWWVVHWLLHYFIFFKVVNSHQNSFSKRRTFLCPGKKSLLHNCILHHEKNILLFKVTSSPISW